MDPSKFSQAGHDIVNRINTSLHINDGIKEIKDSFTTFSTQLKNKIVLEPRKNKIVLQPRNETSKAGEASKAPTAKSPSLKSLFPSKVSEILKDSKETVTQNFIVKELAKALNNVFPQAKEQTGSKNFEPRPYVDSSDVRATSEDLDEFSKSKSNVNGEKGKVATHYKRSIEEMNSKIAIGVRDRYQEHQKIAENGGYSKTPDELNDDINELSSRQDLNDEELKQLKSLKLERHIRDLSPEDQKKFLSLKPEEGDGLRLYTTEDGYRHINYTLDGNIRNKETFESDKPRYRKDPTYAAESIEVAKLTIEVIGSALNKLPGYDKTVYKSVRLRPEEVKAYRQAHQNGIPKAMLSKKFFSTTKSKEQAERFDEMNSKKLDDGTLLTKVIYQIDSPPGKKLTGADITYLSAKDGEEEVLFNYGSVFRFTGMEDVPAIDENGIKKEAYIIIKFREVQSKEK